MIDDFEGMAATVRFDDGAVEVEVAMADYEPHDQGLIDSQTGADMVAGLPEDTVAAFGMSLEEGWVGAMLELRQEHLPDESATIDEQLAQVEAETGLDLPRGRRDPARRGRRRRRSAAGSTPTPWPTAARARSRCGIRIDGDADEIQAVLDKIAAQAAAPSWPSSCR